MQGEHICSCQKLRGEVKMNVYCSHQQLIMVGRKLLNSLENLLNTLHAI